MKRFFYLLVFSLAALLGGCTDDDEYPHLTLFYNNYTTQHFSAQSSEDENVTVEVSTIGEKWSVTTDQTWCMVTVNGSKFTISVLPNPLPVARKAIVTVSAGRKYKTQQVINVEQEGLYLIETTPQGAMEIPYEGGEFDILLKTNTPWESSSDKRWASISPTEGNVSKTIKLTVEENKYNEESEATLTFKNAGPAYDYTSTELKINRAPNPNGFYLSLSPTDTQEVPYTGGTFDATVSSNTSWTASSNKTWARLSSVEGSGNAQLQLFVELNLKNKADEAILRITAGEIFKRVKIRRAANPDGTYLSITPSSTRKVENAGEDFQVQIRTNTDWTISTDKEWVASNEKQGSGNYYVRLTVEPNVQNKTENALVTFRTAEEDATLKVVRTAYRYIRSGYGGSIVYSFDGQNIREGTYGSIRYTFDNKYIKERNGRVVYSIDGTHIRERYSGPVKFTIDNNYIREGYSGKVLYSIE